jgi:hypothetical protein
MAIALVVGYPAAVQAEGEEGLITEPPPSGTANPSTITEPPPSGTASRSVDDVLGGINSGVDRANTGIDNLEGALNQQNRDMQETNGTVEEVMGNVLDEHTASSIGGIFGTYRNISSLIDRVKGLGQEIAGILSNFDLDKLLDILSINWEDIFSDIYGTADGDSSTTGTTGGAEVFSGVEAGDMGLPIEDQVNATIDETGTTPLMEFLESKQEGGSYAGRTALKNLFRVEETEEVAEATALGADGQTKLKQNTEAANDALKTSTAMMEDSEEQDVSQNIMRNISVQAHETTVHTELLAIDAQLRARDDSLRNSLLGKSLLEIQGERVRDRRQDASAYSGVITAGGSFYLPGLSQEEEK